MSFRACASLSISLCACHEAPDGTAHVAPSSTAVRPAPSYSEPPVEPAALPSAAPAMPVRKIASLPGVPACRWSQREPFGHVGGELSPEAVIFGYQQLRPSLMACLEKILQRPAKLNGSLGLEPDGTPCGAEFSGAVALPPEVLACLGHSVRRHRFERAETGTRFQFTLTYPPPGPP